MLALQRHGFTVVEMLIVIVVVGILASVATFGYRGVQTRAANTELQSDTANIGEQLELAFIKNKKYPANISALGLLPKDSTTNVTYASNDISYCLATSSTKAGLNAYTVRDNQKMQSGDCSGWTPTPIPGATPPATYYAESLDAPDPITPCAEQSGGGNFGWPSPPASLIPYFAVSFDGYDEYLINNTLSSQGTFIYWEWGQGAMGTTTITVQYVDADGGRSPAGTGTGTFYGDCYD